MGNTKVKKKVNVQNVDPKLKIVFKLIFHEKPVTLSEITRISGIPRQLVSYHLPALIDQGVMIKVEPNKYMLQKHLYHIEENCQLLCPLIQEISDSIQGEYDDLEKVIHSNLFYFLANLTFEIE